ncbi:MAG: orotidine-5'-phosphate decarboxylase [Candidatus Aminicenantes bacterium]|nr:orotidine-5'-phosphate decarboxylase [Candidatus Aminicenantes bacterium]
MIHPIAPEERIITALDVKIKDEALALVRTLESAVLFKVGLQLYTAEGPALLREIRALGKKVFLDLKLHDIPNTVAEAVRSAMRLGAWMTTIHASGGRTMMEEAAKAAADEAARTGLPKPVLLGVTVLTSLKDADLQEVGFAGKVMDQVLKLAGLAQAAGFDGVVCSPREIEAVRREFGPALRIVTPGIRPAGADAHDQKRIMTPAQAVALGADYLVIGRPITAAPSPDTAFRAIAAEVRRPA